MNINTRRHGLTRQNKLLYLLVWLMISTGGFFFFYNIYTSLITKEVNIISQLASREIISVNGEYESLLISAEINLSILADNHHLKEYIQKLQPYQTKNPEDHINNDLDNFVIQMLRLNPKYYSISFIDTAGRERLNVQNKDKEQIITPANRLNSFSKDKFIQECLNSTEDSIYYSNIELEKTDGVIDFPFRPSLKVCKNVYSHIGKLKGLIVITINISFPFPSHISVLNERGDWLLGGGENWMNFAFSRINNFSTIYPKAWKYIISNEFGNIIVDGIYFEFTTLRPPSTDEGISWKIISQHSTTIKNESGSISSIPPIFFLYGLYEFILTAIIIIFYIRQSKLFKYQHIIETNLEHYDISLKAGRAMSWTYYPDNHAFSCSRHIESLLGISPEKITHEQDFIELLKLDPSSKIKNFISFINSTIHSPGHNEFSIEHKIPLPHAKHNISSSEIWLKTYAIRLKDGADKTIIYGISIDITNRILLEQSSIESRKASEKLSLELQNLLDESERLRIRAEEASMAKAEFLTNISHEIRTPMNSILGMVSLLEETVLNREQNNYLSTIKHSGEALLLIINDILDHSKIESGSLDIVEEPFNIRDTLSHIIDMIKPQAMANSVKVTDYTDPLIPDILLGDDLRITQVLLNLASNAVKFTSRGNIHFELNTFNISDETYTVEIKVSDTGIGIAPEAFEHIFDKFTQADQSTTRKFGGTGLGLSICKSLIEMMHGSITVESELGKSTTFTIILPLKKNFLTRSRPVIDKPEFSSSAITRSIVFPKAKILLCEDNEMNQNLCLKFLEKFNTTADVAANGLIAIDMFIEKEYDLILMDLQMPELSGLSATKRIRDIEKEQQKNHTPIIAVTANIFDNDRQACNDAGMDGFMAKPISLKEFREVLIKFLPKCLHEIGQTEVSRPEAVNSPTSQENTPPCHY